MIKQKIYFRADASDTIGYGHFIRTLALADMLKEDFECTFFTSFPSDYQIKEMKKVCNYIPLNEETKLNDFINLLEGDEIVVLDNYFFTTEYQKLIKQKGCKLVCVDDMHDKHYVSDVVINHGTVDSTLFSREIYTRLCLGLEWALLRKPFLVHRDKIIKEGNWLIAFGGSDINNLTEKFVKHIHCKPYVKSITVVIGDSYQFIRNLQVYDKINVRKNLSAEEMAVIMNEAEYAILSSSSVCIEALSQGCKIYTGWYVDNQKNFYDYIVTRKYANGIGNLLSNEFNIIDYHIENTIRPCEFDQIQNNYINLFRNDLFRK